ncbi:hypothetical protein AB0M80_03395 [Amycolatopsis sp. NPDC051045]|uniref:hypothetical protein n=1 Tax=Amycolatopsis sp. NPDC051045 TaxID=3156922 RepID=UPI0034348FA0
MYDPNTRRAPLPGPNGMPVAGSYGRPSSGSSASGGFEYDEGTLHELVREWNDLANEFARDLSHATSLQRAEGPGIEYASGGNAEQIKASGDALYTTLKAREEYCRSMAKKFETALGKYATAEDTHSTDLNRTGGSL